MTSGDATFMPYCNFATIGLSEMNVNSFRFSVKGSGMMRPMKMTISATRRRKTLWKRDTLARKVEASRRVHRSESRAKSSCNTYKAVVERHFAVIRVVQLFGVVVLGREGNLTTTLDDNYYESERESRGQVNSFCAFKSDIVRGAKRIK